MPSTALLRSLPYPELMRRRLRTFAMVDAILAPEFRSFEWHPEWGAKEQMGAFKDGEGNFFFAWFCPSGAVLRGFDHESPISPFREDPPQIWPGIFDGLPKKLAYANEEPAFALDRSWANQYYGQELDQPAVERIWWEREPLDWATVEVLNPDFDEAVVREEAKLLGWKADLPKRAPRPKAKPKPKPAAAPAPKAKSFGAAEFVVRCEPTRVVMRVHGKDIAVSHEDIYGELFDLVRARFDRR